MTIPLILIVDDTPSNIHVLAQALRSDYEVKIATSGPLALELAHLRERPDLILLDVMMPEMDGYEVCRRLKSDPATHGIPVIFITAMTEDADEARGLELGAIDYIGKPFNPAIVRARVRNHIALKRNADLLEALASIDALTGLANRRRFDQQLAIEWQRGLRGQGPLAVLFADIDHFKAYNDHFGHGAGDDCLVRVAESFAASLTRPGDVAARYGGEEFVALLPATDPEGALEVAERFRAAVEARDLTHAPASGVPRVTVSVGYASVIPIPGMEPAALVDAADHALYRAKGDGRNCVRPDRVGTG